jgi:hypothetical protein
MRKKESDAELNQALVSYFPPSCPPSLPPSLPSSLPPNLAVRVSDVASVGDDKVRDLFAHGTRTHVRRVLTVGEGGREGGREGEGTW